MGMRSFRPRDALRPCTCTGLLWGYLFIFVMIIAHTDIKEAAVHHQTDTLAFSDDRRSSNNNNNNINNKGGGADSTTSGQDVDNLVLTRATIFVSIVSYRDGECARTMQDMFAQAAHPDRVFVGVVQQHSPEDGDIDCKEACSGCPKSNIRIYRMHARDAQGPAHARYLASSLYLSEAYYMQIDAHTRFVPQWDVVVTKMHNGLVSGPTANTRAVISHYPNSANTQNERSIGTEYIREFENRTATVCWGNFDPDGMLHPRAIIIPRTAQPLPQALLVAGFLFTSGSFVTEVPFDPHLPFLFWGEEFLLSARAFTHGYDVYGPSENIAFHFYTRRGKPKVWSAGVERRDDDDGIVTTNIIANATWLGTQQRSLDRVRYLMQLPDPWNSTRPWVAPAATDAPPNVPPLPTAPAAVSSSGASEDSDDPDPFAKNVSTLHVAVSLDADVYGLGSRRALADFYERARIRIADYQIGCACPVIDEASGRVADPVGGCA
eukprot:PhM_4_TR735/c0_g1_i1/m.29137